MPERERATIEACRGLLKALGQTIKLFSLYGAGHPVPASAAGQACQQLREVLTVSGWTELAAALTAGRWVVNGVVIAESAQAFELLALALRTHAVRSVAFRPGTRIFELSAFCEMASTPPNRAYETDAADFLAERGVRNVTVNLEEFVERRKIKPRASLLIESPVAAALAARRRQAAAAPDGVPGGSDGFGGFIKSLIDQSVPDAAARGRVYAEAVRLVEQALARHVSEATHQLLAERQVLVNERVRAETVLSSVADGKLIVDTEGRVLMMDPAAEQLVGRPLSELAGKPVLELAEGGEKIVSLARDLVTPENRPLSPEVDTAGDAQLRDALRQSMALVEDEKGRLVGTYAVAPDAVKFREALRMQDEFVAKVTHDLKAPLASICAALDLLASRGDRSLGVEEKGFLEICQRNAKELASRIGEVLDFSSLRAGRLGITPRAVELAALLADAVSALEPWARSREVVLSLDADAAPRMIAADPARIGQVLQNLISNAIKNTPPKGAVRVTAADGGTQRPGIAVITVADTGRGIDEVDQKRLFEKFVQVGPDRGEGVGLGLSIAREIIGRHGGEIWVESEPGKGARFSFTVPKAKPGRKK